MLTIEKIKEKFQHHSHGVHVIILMQRKKEGGSNNPKYSNIEKVITHSSEEYFNTIERMMKIVDTDERNLRIYATLNARDPIKAIRNFRMRELKNSFELPVQQEKFYFNLKNQFISCLMDKSSRQERYLLFDLDGAEVDDYFMLLLCCGFFLNAYDTKNGKHVITCPFNYTKLPEPLLSKCLNVDGMVLIYWKQTSGEVTNGN